MMLDRVAAWPKEDQDRVIRLIDEIEATRQDVYRLNNDERAAARRGLAEMRAGDLASDEEVAAVFDRHR